MSTAGLLSCVVIIARVRNTLLGGLAPLTFLQRHWQKRPLLIRNAIPGFGGLLGLRELIGLAGRDDCESRLVIRDGAQWHVLHGPISRPRFRALPYRDWTLLVHGIDHFLPAARALLSRFSFIPHSRLDDLMVSYARPGGGVGPHFDSYDVFLLQATGRRSWQVSAQTDLALADDVPLKTLKRFRPDGQCILQPGDMLYLPPRIAHDGVALDACFTYSIGFRAPAYDELKSRFLAYLDDAIQLDGIYRDPDLEPVSHPGLIGHAMVARVGRTLSKISWNRQTILDFLGRYLTEPKLQVVFERPPAISLVRFAATARRAGVELSLASQLLVHRHRGFINGESFALSDFDRNALIALADRRRLESEKLPVARHTLRILYGWYLAGYIRFMARGPT